VDIAQIEKTLKNTLNILNKCLAKYRVLGSVLVVAASGKLHRNIKDIDILTEKSKLNCLVQNFKKQGFKVKINKELGMNIVASIFKKDFLKINLALLGKFTSEGFTQSLPFIKTTKYIIGKTKFIGIPLEVQHYTMRKSKSKPGRSLDFHTLKNIISKDLTNNKYPALVSIAGIPIPGAFSLFSSFKNSWEKQDFF